MNRLRMPKRDRETEDQGLNLSQQQDLIRKLVEIGEGERQLNLNVEDGTVVAGKQKPRSHCPSGQSNCLSLSLLLIKRSVSCRPTFLYHV